MILRILILALTFAIHLSAASEKTQGGNGLGILDVNLSCNGCETCRQKPSAVQLFQAVQEVLNDQILLLPQLQPQLIAQLQEIITEGHIGVVGATGPQGPQGPAGATGPQGSQGAQGAQGPAGSAGSQGPAGATGEKGGILDFLYVYNLTAQTIAIEATVPFDTNGLITPGFTHAAGSDSILVINAGVYEVKFSVSGTEPNQFALFLNGGPVAGTIYGSGAGTQQNTGQAIFAMSAGDTLTLVNHSSAAAVGLASVIGGTQANVNASITILRLQ